MRSRTDTFTLVDNKGLNKVPSLARQERSQSRTMNHSLGGTRQSFRGLVKRKRGMSFDEFLAVAASKASCHSVAGVSMRRILSVVNSVHSSPLLDKVLNTPCKHSPGADWDDESLDDTIDRLPLLSSATR
ncbi:hypothetical protein FE257_003505 [Aspergillus nanangensis]|uniref:Uncharacterized protein n=1 Tax=Aspergillus nanangensis TaxID=2582783 RepID=A0AAD4GNG5_ASPNN|nr:hypothetical protein FE257_003505 [Aspergillus nanangensis]